MCRVLRIDRSGWYAWSRYRHQIKARLQFRLTCDETVRQAFGEAKQRYGAPRLSRELPDYNIKTIAASLRRQGLRAKAARKFSPVQLGQDPATIIFIINIIKKIQRLVDSPNSTILGQITQPYSSIFACRIRGNKLVSLLSFESKYNWNQLLNSTARWSECPLISSVGALFGQ